MLPWPSCGAINTGLMRSACPPAHEAREPLLWPRQVTASTMRPLRPCIPGPCTMRELIPVVNYQPKIRALLSEVLTARGREVYLVADGGAVVNGISKCGYDLVMSDCETPVLTGREVYEVACRIRPEVSARFVFLMGHPKALPADLSCPVIPKPSSLKVLLDVVGAILHPQDGVFTVF